MSGKTDNKTILAAANQIVTAINDLKTAIGELNMNIVQTNNCGCCGSSGTTGTTNTTTSPGAPGSGQPGAGGPGDPPPTTTITPPDGQELPASRKCKVAMWLVDQYLTEMIRMLDSWHADDFIINPSITIGRSIIDTMALLDSGKAVLINLLGGPETAPIWIWPAFEAAVGEIIIANLYVDFSEMLQYLEDEENRNQLVCALNTSSYPAGAVAAIWAVISDAPNLSPGNTLFLSSLITSPATAQLFYIDQYFLTLEGQLTKFYGDTPCPCADDISTEGTPTDEYKCKAIHYLLDSLSDTVTNFSSISGMSWLNIGSLLTSLGGGMLKQMMSGIFDLDLLATKNAVWNMAALISDLGYIAWYGFDRFGAFEEINAYLTANKEDLVCALLEASTVEAAKGVLTAFVADAVGSVVAANSEWTEASDSIKSAIADLLTNSIVSVIFGSGTDEWPEIAALDADCSFCNQAESFNGWTIPLYSQAIPVVNLADTHNGVINPGTEIFIGQFVDGFPTPLHTLYNDGTPETIDRYGRVNTNLELISPTFTSQQDAQIIFTIAGGGSGGAAEDAQWHFYTYAGGSWTTFPDNYGNGEHTVTVPADATRAIISYVSPFSHSNPLPHVAAIQHVGLTI